MAGEYDAGRSRQAPMKRQHRTRKGGKESLKRGKYSEPTISGY